MDDTFLLLGMLVRVDENIFVAPMSLPDLKIVSMSRPEYSSIENNEGKPP